MIVMSYLECFRSYMRVSRWQIQLVSLATVLLGPLFAAEEIAEVLSLDVLLFAVLFYSVVTFACNINCYYDVEVDSLRKVKLARSVEHLGKKLVVLMGFEVITAIIVISLLFIRGYLIVGSLGILGLVLAYVYSAPPIRVKSGGVLSPVPVIFGVYIIPPIAGYLVVDSELSVLFLLFVTGYALLNLGINLVNVAEDHTVDRDTGIRTVSHTLGLKRTVFTAFGTMFTGTVVILVVFLTLLTSELLVLILFAVCAITLFAVISDVSVLVTAKTELEGKVQQKAKKLPLYFIITRYPMVLFLLFFII